MINKRQFLSLISKGSFRELFVSELGWNRFRGQAQLPAITVDEVDYCFTTIAERNGFQILTCSVNAIPTNSICKKIVLNFAVKPTTISQFSNLAAPNITFGLCR